MKNLQKKISLFFKGLSFGGMVFLTGCCPLQKMLKGSCESCKISSPAPSDQKGSHPSS